MNMDTLGHVYLDIYSNASSVITDAFDLIQANLFYITKVGHGQEKRRSRCITRILREYY